MEVKVSLLPAVWKEQRGRAARSLGCLYWDVVFLQLAAYVAVQDQLDSHHQDVQWKNDVWVQL